MNAPNICPVEELARQWRVPVSTLLRECRHLLLLPVQAAEARMQEEVPPVPAPKATRPKKGATRG